MVQDTLWVEGHLIYLQYQRSSEPAVRMITNNPAFLRLINC